jgi:hemerythrin
MKGEKGVFIPWDDQYSIGVPMVDEQHRQLLDLANALYETCREGSTSARDGFKSAARATAEYIRTHFLAEEQIMDRVGYSDAAAHRAEHKEFIKTFLGEVKAFEEGKPFVSHAFANFLKEWVLRHIAMTDKKMGAHLVKMAKNGEFNLSQEG